MSSIANKKNNCQDKDEGIQLTRITSKTPLSKGFRLRGAGLEKTTGGVMYAGLAERIVIQDLRELASIISGLNTHQALAFGSIIPDGDRHTVVRKTKQKDGQHIARTREFFEFRKGEPGILLLDYDAPKDDGVPLDAPALKSALDALIPELQNSEVLIAASASTYIYHGDQCLRGAGGLHAFVRAADASEIPAIGNAIAGRCWLAGLGHIETTRGGAKVLRTLLDESVWQPERLSFDAGADCGAGLRQCRPDPVYYAGTNQGLRLSDVKLTDAEWDQVAVLQADARGVRARTVKNDVSLKRAVKESLGAVDLPAYKKADIMRALLHIPADIDYQTWVQIGMGLKNALGDAGFILWDRWSEKAANYTGTASLRVKWAGFNKSGVSIDTIYYHARKYGYGAKTPIIELPLPIHPIDPIELADSVSVEQAQTDTYNILCDAILNAEKKTTKAVQITVGVGKTSALRRLISEARLQGVNVTIVARDKVQCAEYEKAGAFWRHGRENTREGFANPHHCPHASGDGGFIVELGKKEHYLMQTCTSGRCEHGNKYMLDAAEENNKEPSKTVVRFFDTYPAKLATEACGFFNHINNTMNGVRVVTAAGVSQADIKNADVVVIDEGIAWTHSQYLNLDEVRGYIETLQSYIDRAEITMDDAAEADKVIGMLEPSLKVFKYIAEYLGWAAGNVKKGVYEQITVDVKNTLAKLNDDLIQNGVALWEQPQWNESNELLAVPLRAASAISEGIKADSLSVRDGCLHTVYVHPALSYGMQSGIPLVILDATLDDLARNAADTVHHIVAAPNVEWVCDPRWFQSAKSNMEHLEKEAKNLLDTKKKMEEQTGRPAFVLCRKVLGEYIAAVPEHDPADPRPYRERLWNKTIEDGIGWYGWHDVAHDEWSGRDAILWGQMPLDNDTVLQQYADYRAGMRILDLATDLPLPDNSWLKGQTVATGEYNQDSLARLPAQPEVRDWLLKKMADQRIQGAGRSRAIRQGQTMVVWQIGGYPMVGLAEHGIRVRYDRLIDRKSGAEMAAINAKKRMRFMDVAAAGCIADGREVSRSNIREFGDAICKSLNLLDSKCEPSVRATYIYINQSRTDARPQGLNVINGLQDPSPKAGGGGAAGAGDGGLDGGFWNGEYEQWRESCMQVYRSYLADGAEDYVPVPIIEEPEAEAAREAPPIPPDIQKARHIEGQTVTVSGEDKVVSIKTSRYTPEQAKIRKRIFEEMHILSNGNDLAYLKSQYSMVTHTESRAVLAMILEDYEQ